MTYLTAINAMLTETITTPELKKEIFIDYTIKQIDHNEIIEIPKRFFKGIRNFEVDQYLIIGSLLKSALLEKLNDIDRVNYFFENDMVRWVLV